MPTHLLVNNVEVPWEIKTIEMNSASLEPGKIK